jgi:hypothetical protein
MVCTILNLMNVFIPMHIILTCLWEGQFHCIYDFQQHKNNNTFVSCFPIHVPFTFSIPWSVFVLSCHTWLVFHCSGLSRSNDSMHSHITWGWVSVSVGGYKERVKEDENCRSTMYSCIKI